MGAEALGVDFAQTIKQVISQKSLRSATFDRSAEWGEPKVSGWLTVYRSTKCAKDKLKESGRAIIGHLARSMITASQCTFPWVAIPVVWVNWGIIPVPSAE